MRVTGRLAGDPGGEAGRRGRGGKEDKLSDWLLVLNGLYVLLLIFITVSNRLGPDRFWLGALNFYLPQLMWAFPGAILLALTLRQQRAWAVLPLLGILWVFGPIMGYNWSTQPTRAEAAGTALRVMTWNIKYGKHDLMPLIAELQRCRPDVVLFQDAVGAASGPLADYFRDWQVRRFGQYLIASRYPLAAAEPLEIPYREAKKASLLRCRLSVGHSVVSLYNVHFKTPRRSLNAFRKVKQGAWHIPVAIERFDDNVAIRQAQAEAVAGYLANEEGSVIVAGDFNSPSHSLVCERLRDAGLRDAFDERGRGYGYTYGHLLLKDRAPWLRHSWMRIDHIMAAPRLSAQRCWVGTGAASDHRPVIADFIIKDPT